MPMPMATQSLCLSFKCFYTNFYSKVRCFELGSVWFLIWFSTKTWVKTQIKLVLYTLNIHHKINWRNKEEVVDVHTNLLDNEPDFLQYWTQITNNYIVKNWNNTLYPKKLGKPKNIFAYVLPNKKCKKTAAFCWYGKNRPIEKGIHISKFIIGKETLKVLINFVTLFESSYLQYLDRRR